jgi:phosphatidylcholine synthase
MKSDDHFFIGFPSYWEVVAMYMVFLEPTRWLTALMLLIPGILTFIPLRYLYPTRNSFLQRETWVLGILWLFLWLYILLDKDSSKTWVYISLYYPIFYMLGSFYANYQLSQDAK